MNKYPSPVIMTAYTFACITVGILIMYFAEKYDNRFSSPSSSVPVPATVAGPGRIKIENGQGFVIEDCTFTMTDPNDVIRRMRVSAYCPGPCCCGNWADGITASGVPAVGLIVAAPTDIPFGTVLQIPGYGTAQVQDRGGAITGDRLDVLFATHEEAKQWGVQELKVRIIR